MTFFKLFAKVNYWINAKNRHGIHSPFVYQFVEQVLNKPIDTAYSQCILFLENEHLNKRQASILAKTLYQYGFLSITINKKIFKNDAAKSNERILILDNIEELINNENENNLIVLLNIHENERQEKNWYNSRNTEQVRLSIDLFDLGLLFFKNEFKVVQHFILK